ncbi:LysR family transcriptional regulator [Salinisphaera sp. RV14]|uniref:LysR family transcriptional regulator n=1 Tax=unclassified Salinisphaera TaxID=2649847 RepID=UPI003F84363A
MNLHHLAIFHAVARTGSLSRASGVMHVTQPALSRELRAFEQRLGVRLFDRHPRGMRLTEPGRLLADYAARLFALEAEARAAMDAAAGARAGRFAIGASNTVGTYVLPAILAAFGRAQPAIDIALHVDNTRHVAEGVADMRYLIGFIEGPLHVGGLTATTFRTDVIVPVLSAGLARETDDRSTLPLLLREPGSGTRELIESRIATTPMAGASVMEFSNTEALKQAAIHGGGVAWLPRIAIVDELARGVLVVFGSDALQITRELRLVTRRGAYLPPAARAFITAAMSAD